MQTKLTKETSQKIKNMGLLCAVLVVVIHADWPNDTALSLGWFINYAIKYGLARIAVPFFFVVSGFFLARHFDDEGWWRREVKKRVKSLLVPYITWSLIALAAFCGVSLVGDLLAARPLGSNIHYFEGLNWLRILGLDFTDYPLLVPLWYVRCLMLLVLASSVIKKLADKAGLGYLICVICIYALAAMLPSDRLNMAFATLSQGLLYFSIWIFIQQNRLDFAKKIPFAIYVFLGAILLAASLVFECKGWKGSGGLARTAAPLMLYCIWHKMSFKKIPDWLTSCAFPVFLMHMIIMGVIVGVWIRIGMSSLGIAFAQVFTSIILSCAVAVALRKYTPRLAAILFGGR